MNTMHTLKVLAVAALLAPWGGTFAADAPSAEAEFLKLLPGLAPKTRARRQALFPDLHAGDAPAGADILKAVAKEHDALIRKLEGRLDASHLKSLRQQAQEDLAARRKEALALIMNEARYPYHGAFGGESSGEGSESPYGPQGKEIQAQVEALVAAVEEVYRPSVAGLAGRLRRSKSAQSRSTADVLDAIGEAEAYLQAGGTPSGDTLLMLLERTLPRLDFSQEAESTKKNAKVLEENVLLAKKFQAEGTLDEQEADCMLSTNRYRIMMGLTPLEIDPRLVQASRGHSRDMVARGFFAHVDPDGRGSMDRARAAGFEGGSLGENIAMGPDTGEGAFRDWFSSSGHHRNMLLPGHAVIGVGRSGTHWTMLLGR